MINKALFFLAISLCSIFVFSSIFAFRNRGFGRGKNIINCRKGYNMRNFGRDLGRRGCRWNRGSKDGSGPNPNCPLKDPNIENPNPRNPKHDGTGPNKNGKGPRGTNLGPKEDCPNKQQRRQFSTESNSQAKPHIHLLYMIQPHQSSPSRLR